MTSASAKSAGNKRLIQGLLCASGGQDGGWNRDLFLTELDDDYLCSVCHHVCKNAVTLDCHGFGAGNENDEHKDDEIKPFCESCIKHVLLHNGNKCPISQHADPKYIASRIARKQIMKCKVLCPTAASTSKNARGGNPGGNSEGLEEDEDEELGAGGGGQHVHATRCVFKGTLAELINVHIDQCVANYLKRNKVTQVQAKMMDELQEEVRGLKQTVSAQTTNMQQLLIAVRYLLMANTNTNTNTNTSANTEDPNTNTNANTNANSILKKYPLLSFNNNNPSAASTQLLRLEVHSLRKSYAGKSEWHPKHLFTKGGNNRGGEYCSAENREFAEHEADWIVFSILGGAPTNTNPNPNPNPNTSNHNSNGGNGSDGGVCFMPTELRILNNSIWKHGVSSMQVLIGSAADNEWMALHSVDAMENIQLSTTELQSIPLDVGGTEFVQQLVRAKQWKNLKLVFLANHGQTGGGYGKIRFSELYAYGCAL